MLYDRTLRVLCSTGAALHALPPDLVGLLFTLLQGGQLHCLQVGFVLLSVPCALLLVRAAALRSLLLVPLALHLVLHEEAVHVELHLLQVAVQERLPPHHGARHGRPAWCTRSACAVHDRGSPAAAGRA